MRPIFITETVMDNHKVLIAVNAITAAFPTTYNGRNYTRINLNDGSYYLSVNSVEAVIANINKAVKMDG